MENHMSYLFNDQIRFNGEAIDAFARLKVSTPFTLFDSQHRYQQNDKWDTLVTSGGSIEFKPNESVVDLKLTTASGAKVCRETKRVFAYQPGKSLLVLSTFAFAATKANLRQRVGYFGTQNGIYLEQNGNDVYLVLRTYVNGSVDDTTYKVSQANWNGDKFNGTGPSGRTLDLTKANILVIDIEWLGVGDVRVGFFADGRPVIAHTFHNDNLRPTTYMTTASLPLRMEIENLSTTASASTAKQICNSVMSEAGFEGFSRRYNIAMGTTTRQLAGAGTLYPVMSLKLNSDRLDSVIVPSNVSALVTTNNIAQYRILLNSTFGGTTPTWSTHYNGSVDYVIHNPATTLDNIGNDIIGGYINTGGLLTISDINDFNFQLGRTQAGVSDIITIAMAGKTGNTDVLVDFSWFEII
jgi:hypothetical protein